MSNEHGDYLQCIMFVVYFKFAFATLKKKKMPGSTRICKFKFEIFDGV